ncbi:MAG: VanW family protein [Firmicutes bacterium]|nr:VanW family protein [Bacillota bacterium]
MKKFLKPLSIVLATSMMCSAAFAAETEAPQNTETAVENEAEPLEDTYPEEENIAIPEEYAQPTEEITAEETAPEAETTIIYGALSPDEIAQSKTVLLRDPFYVEPPKPAPVQNNEYDYDIASYSTKFSTSSAQYNRNYNMQLAAEAINGTILQPGDSFSYNNTLLSKSNGGEGYLSAGILVNGQAGTGRGGGICQVSSTLFQAALYSGMTITSRASHSSKVGYLPAGRDATVSWGSVDFCFRNDLSIPVKIQAYAYQGEVLVRFWSQEKPPSFNNIEVNVKYTGNSYAIYRYVDGYCDYVSYSRYG